jgi:hypothetical protein
VIGVLGGFFGVGGSFLSGPSLFSLGMPYNFVVGTDLIHIVGKSIVAARQHRILGNIDLKLAMVMVIGTLVGSETGVDAIEALKHSGEVNLVVGVTAIVVFTGISLFGACVRSLGEGFSGGAVGAKDQFAAVWHREDLDLVDRFSFLCRRLLQRFSRRRRRVYPDAGDGLSSWYSHSYCRRHRPV